MDEVIPDHTHSSTDESNIAVTPTDPLNLPGLCRTFTAPTCLQLLKNLDSATTIREYNFLCLYDPKLPKHGTKGAMTIQQLKLSLGANLENSVNRQFDFVLNQSTASNTSSSQINHFPPVPQIVDELSAINENIAELRALVPTAPPTSPPSSPTVPRPLPLAADLLLPNGQTIDYNFIHHNKLPYQHYHESPLSPMLSLNDLLSSIPEAELHHFRNRSSKYYGVVPYPYGNHTHPPCDLDSNPFMKSLVNQVVPIIGPGVKFNSALVNIYKDGSKSMPAHVDGESAIQLGSLIITIRFGADRTMIVRSLIGSGTEYYSLKLKHGDILVMTRESQDYYDHGIPAASLDTGPSASVTLRMMCEVPSAPIVPRPINPEISAPSPKRVLVLGDSLNKDFDPYMFRYPIVCYKEPLKQLRNLLDHEQSIAKSDLVIISAGVNDLTTLHIPASTAAATLARNMEYLQEKYPNVEFLLNSVSPVGIRYQSSSHVNNQIDMFNNLCFDYAMYCADLYKHFRIFDILEFGLAHISGDSKHLTPAGQHLYSKVWVSVALLKLGFRRGKLPLRGAYQQRAYGTVTAGRHQGRGRNANLG